MLLANFISTLFYAVSYPYIYAETIKVVPYSYIGFEQILTCLSTILFCKLWNTYGDKLFKHYRLILLVEIIADIILFGNVLIKNNLSVYFLLNIIIYSLITRNVICGGTKMRAKVHPDEKSRERYDNNNQIVSSIATLMGAGYAIIYSLDIKYLFVCALIGNIIDNIFYLYIYEHINVQNVR